MENKLTPKDYCRLAIKQGNKDKIQKYLRKYWSSEINDGITKIIPKRTHVPLLEFVSAKNS